MGFTQEEKATLSGYIVDYETYNKIPFSKATLYKYLEDSTLIEVAVYHAGQSAKYEFEFEPGQAYKVIGNAPEYQANEVEINPPKPGEKLWKNIRIALGDIIFICHGWGIYGDPNLPKLPLTFYILDSETKEKIVSPEIDLYAVIDSNLIRIYSSVNFEVFNPCRILFRGDKRILL